MTASRTLWIAVVVTLAIAVPAAVAGPARFVTIDYPNAVATYALGINPAGDVVGGYSIGGDDEHGFVLHHGTYTSYDYAGATWTEFEAITPQGDILGEYGLADNTIHSFLLRDGTAYPVDIVDQPSNLGLANTVAVHINPQGAIVGCYHQSRPDGTTIMDAMFGYTMTPDGVVQSAESARSMHNGINPAGDVVGIYYNAAGMVPQSYLIHNGQTTWFSFPNSVVTQAWDISATGAIVGFHKTSNGKLHGFLFASGQWTSFDVPGARQTKAFGINPGGAIVGYFVDAAFNFHGFLRVPDDE